MNHSFIIKTTNRIALYASVALLYWVLIFLTITIFDLKIFRGHMTEIFYLSILGIFAILGGSIVLNVMSNLSKISEAITEQFGAPSPVARRSRLKIYIAIASMPLIVSLLFLGNELSAQKKKEMLVSAAQAMVAESSSELGILAHYEFGPSYIQEAAKILSVMEKIDKNFPEAMVIVPDQIGTKSVFMVFQSHLYNESNEEVAKQNYIFSSASEDRTYLQSVFSSGNTDMRFLANGGNYELYLPVQAGNKTIVLYFSDLQRYGKFGS